MKGLAGALAIAASTLFVPSHGWTQEARVPAAPGQLAVSLDVSPVAYGDTNSKSYRDYLDYRAFRDAMRRMERRRHGSGTQSGGTRAYSNRRSYDQNAVPRGSQNQRSGAGTNQGHGQGPNWDRGRRWHERPFAYRWPDDRQPATRRTYQYGDRSDLAEGSGDRRAAWSR